MWLVWYLLQTPERRRENLEKLLPFKVLLAKGDFLTGCWRQWQSRAPITLAQKFKSRSPEGSIFSSHHHEKQVHGSLLVLVVLISSPVKRPDIAAIGWQLLEKRTVSCWSLPPHKLILHRCFHFCCSKRTARLRYDLCHRALSYCSLCRNTEGTTKSLLYS